MADSKTNGVAPATTPSKATPPSPSERPVGLGSPELIKELQKPHVLKHVPVPKGSTIIFHGQGRQNQEAESKSKTSQ